MQNSGTKLVVALVGLAFALGVTSWWYRFEAAHRASHFWGPEASRLIAESEGFEAIRQQQPPGEGLPAENNTQTIDLSKARGQAHLRHALMSDRNYLWDQAAKVAESDWRWTLRFYEGNQQVAVKLSEDLAAIGKYDAAADAVEAYSCEPMTESLRQYFTALGLRAKSDKE